MLQSCLLFNPLSLKRLVPSDFTRLTKKFCLFVSMQKLLYTPLEKLFILQSSEKSSPPHPLVSPGNALYALDKAHPGYLMQALT
ncbi:hypothetical protein V6N13_081122 [Hibiscus sabdariffa]